MLENMKKAKLVLASGEIFNGYAPVWQNETTFGEVIFNTGMTGYEETLTDPSYCGQILTFTYPIIGNYGVSAKEHYESYKIHVEGVICQSIFNKPSHYTSTMTFLEWLKEEKIPLLTGIDTRELTKVIRQYGVVNGALVFDEKNTPNNFPDNMKVDWVAKVSISEPKSYGSGKYKIILVDCGLKHNILNCLLRFDVQVKVVSFDYDYTNEEYDGVFLSNGPGDPKMCKATIAILRKALNAPAPTLKPIYGICLGAQLMALAIDGNTYKLKFGHRGQNQPCIDLADNRCYLTSQNHGYAIDEKSLPEEWVVSFRHLNDNTVAGIRHKTKPLASVQFHPEASPGPEDTFFFFNQFFEQVKQRIC